MNVARKTIFMGNGITYVIKLIIACLLITQSNAHAGFVLGRGVINSENGDTIWAEYNADGGYLILENIKDNDAHTVAGSTLLAYQNQLQAYEVRNPNSQYLPKSTFDSVNITAQNGKPFNKPSIPEEAKIVVLPAADKILTEKHEFIEYIWLPYDLKAMGGIPSRGGQGSVPEVSSYLISKDGDILHEATDEGSSIGPLNGYYYPKDDAGNLILEQREYENGVLPNWSNTSDQLINPVPGVEVWGFGNKRGSSQEDGWIAGDLALCSPKPPIPGYYHRDPAITISARLPFIGFNASEPKQRAYFAHGLAWCDEIPSNIFVSMQSVMGGAQIFNPDAGIVPLTAKTSFYLDTQRNEATYLSSIDFDGDDIKDPASYLKYNEAEKTYIPLDPGAASEATHIGIYFSTGVKTDPITKLTIPSIIRAVDRIPQYINKGLLKTINTVDLAQTDLFVFRVSTGQLITSHKGIEQGTFDDDHTQGGTFNNAFNFEFAMRGPDDYWAQFTPYSDYVSWASATKVTEPFQKRNADHIRPGEQLQLVVINRASGYIGSIKFTSKQVGVGGDINNALDSIIMRPPNLKIWAERVHEIKQGKQVAGEKKSTNLIGNEGITLEDDLAVSIHTEWLDHNGLPLPAELGDFGYTARIAKVTSAPTPDLDALKQNSSNEFAIKPGRNLNVLQFNQKELSRHHFYVQVNPYPKSQQNDFGSEIYNPLHKNYLPDGSGTDEHELPSVENTDLEGNQTSQANPLRYRPAHYVPFKVPLYDEQYSQIQQDIYDDLKEQGKAENLEKPDPLYRWYYRPELQFSQYNFDAKSLIVNQTDGEGEESITEINIEDEGTDFGPIFDDYTDSVELLFDLLGPQLDRLPALENDREFVLSLGGEEAIATIGADGKVTFNNPEHLTQLTEADLLSLRLYLNGDAGNILWEYAFEHLNLYPVIDDDILPSDVDGAIEISADDTEIDLVAHIPGFANRSEDSKYDVNIIWENEGAGALARIRDMDGDYAIFKNTLTLPNTVGSTAKISASLYLADNTQTASSDMSFRVVPGRANSVSAALSDASRQMYVGGAGQAIIEGIARDQFGNMVADGTSVTVTTDGSIKLEQSPEATVGGAFSFAISGTDYSEASKVSVRVGEFDQEVDLMINPVDVSFVGLPTEINTGSIVNFTVNVTAGGQPVKDYEFDVWAENARLTQSTITTDDNGRAVLSLIAPPNEVIVKVKAMTAMQSPTVTEVRVKFPNSGKPALNSQMTKMVGDATVESAFEYTRWDDASFSVNKAISGTLDVYGAANTQKTVTIGDIFAPNRLTQAAYWMNDLSEAKDEIGFSNGTLENIGLSKDTRRFAGSSFAFSQGDNSSSMTIASATRLQLENDNSFTVDIKPTQAGGEIFTLGNGLKLELLASGELQLTAETDDGNTYTATQKNPLALNQWHQIAGSFSNNILTLAVGDQRIETAVTGQLSYTSASLNVGQGYSGLMNSLKWFNLASDPLTTFADGSETQSVMLNSLGKATITINSAGKMLSFNSQLPMQSIAVQADDTRQTIELLSTATFEKLAGASLSAGLVEGTPEFNLATLEPTSASSIAQSTPASLLQSEALFPKAHAYNVEFMDVVGIAASLIGLDSLQVIWNQIGNMLGGKEVDIVAFSVALLDVLSLFPPAAPLKAVTIPAKTAIKLLKLGNNKAVQYLGGVMKKMFQQAKGRDFSLVYQGIAFFIIIADMALDEEAREGITEIAKMINSTDDFLDLLEYFSLADDEIALPDTSTASVENTNAFEQFATAKYGVFPQAHAGVLAGIGKALGKSLAELKPLLATLPRGAAPKTFRAFATTVKNLPASQRSRFIKHALTKGMVTGLLVAVKRGMSPKNIQQLIKGFDGQRIPPIALMAIMAYLDDEIDKGRLFDNNVIGTDKARNEQAIKALILKTVPTFVANTDSDLTLIRNAHGAAFHLMHTAMLHAAGQDVIGLEVLRDVLIYPTNSTLERENIKKALIFGRDVDIVTKASNGEIWHEVKSWKSKKVGDVQTNKPYPATPWKWGTGDRKEDGTVPQKAQGTVAHKQFTLDRVAKKIGVVQRHDRDEIAPNINVFDFNWQFHKFVAKSKAAAPRRGELLAKSADLDLVRNNFKKNPVSNKDNLMNAHFDTAAAPTSKIREGALGTLLSIIQGELKEAIEEEKADFNYD